MNGNPAFRAKLRDLTAASINSVSAEILSTNRFYSVITDKNGYLAVNVPWEDNSVHYTLATQNTSGLMSAADKRKLDSLYEADGTGTVKTINTGIGLTGGPITTEGIIKVKLKSETQSSYTSSVGNGDSSRFYSVITDASGDLGVIVPWIDTNTNTEYADVTTSTHGLMTAEDKVKLNSISAGASVASVATGVGLEGGTITSSGTIKAKLKNESLLTVDSTATIGATADKTYSVVPDYSGYLSVYVPWENTEYSAATTSNAGLMSAADKTKLNNIAAGAQPGTVTQVNTGVGLTGGPITESGSIKVNLLNETQLRNAAVAAAETSGRIYPVALDKNGKLAVNVPWVNDNTEYSAMSVNELKTGTASTGRTMTAANIKSAMTGGIFATGETNGTFKVYDTEISIAGLGDLAYINKGTGSAKFLREDGSWQTPENTKYTAGAGLSLTNNQFSIPTNGIKTSMITNGNVTNEKLANSSISIAGNSISLGSSLDAATLISSLGLGSALRFRGITSSTMSDGYTGSVVIGSSTITPQIGDVVIDSSNDYEYVYIDPYWEKLGSDSSYKVIQTAKTDPSASGTSISFISTISQNTQGVITATKANLPEASTSQKGIIQITKANANNFLKLLDTYTDAITDSTPFLRKHATASEYGQQSASALWTYVKNKIGISSTGDTFLRKDGTWATPQDTKYVAATTTAAGLMSAADKAKLDGISANARVGTVTSVSAGVGLLGGPITDTGSIKANLVTETPYQNDAITAFEDPQRLYSVGVDKSGRLAVVVPWANTQITYAPVTQTDNGLMLATDKKKLDGIAEGAQPGTVTQIATNNGIVGGTITKTGTIGLNLKSTTKLTTDANAITDLTNKTYAVSLDKSGYLAVNVPWTDNNTNSYHTTGSWSGITYTATAKGGAEELAFTLPSASTSAPGVVQLSSATNDSSTTVAATASAVKAAYDLAASKTNNTGTVTSVTIKGSSTVTVNSENAITTTGTRTLSITAANASAILNTLTTQDTTPQDNDYFISQYVGGGTTTTTYHRRKMSEIYNYVLNKLNISNKAETLAWNTEKTIASIGGTDITIKLPANPNSNTTYTFTSGTDGSFSVKPSNASAQTVSIGKPATAGTADAVAWSGVTGKPSSFTPSSHTHGNITNDGKINGTGTAIANGDSIAIIDSSASNVITKSSITFDGTTTTQALSKAGTWINVNNYSLPTASATVKGGVKVGDTLAISSEVLNLASVTRTNNTSTASPTHGSTFTAIDSVTTDSYGRVTAVNTKTVTLPSDNNTDTKVTQTAKSDNINYKILFTTSASPTSGSAAEAAYDTDITINPSTNTITATNFAGNASTASKAGAANITTTVNAVAYYTNATGTFGSKASANGALYATSANGALSWGTLPVAQGGTGATSVASIKAGKDGDGNTITSTYATKSELNSLLASKDAMVFKGTFGADGTVTSLPDTHDAGWVYKVVTAGTYAGKVCEIGDLIICVTDGTIANDNDWTVVQTNIDGAVTGPASATDGNVALFDGTSGKVIKQGTISTATVIKTASLSGGSTPTFGTAFSIPNVTGNTNVTASKVTKSNVTVVTAITQADSTSSIIGTVTDGVLVFGKAITEVGTVTSTTGTANTVSISDVTASKVTLGTAFSVPNVTGAGSLPTLSTTTQSVITGIS